MSPKEKAKKVEKILEKFFPHPKIPLIYEDPYTLLIATLLSAQTTDERVNQVTPLLFSLAKTPAQMVKQDQKEIEKIIRPCGLYVRKAQTILNLSKELLKTQKGNVPQTFEELEALPGVGHKTASVVLAEAFHKQTFPVDRHIFRSARRWGLSEGKNVVQVEKDLKKLFSPNKWNKIHLQMILFSRKYCPAIGHHVKDCPICKELLQKNEH